METIAKDIAPWALVLVLAIFMFFIGREIITRDDLDGINRKIAILDQLARRDSIFGLIGMMGVCYGWFCFLFFGWVFIFLALAPGSGMDPRLRLVVFLAVGVFVAYCALFGNIQDVSKKKLNSLRERRIELLAAQRQKAPAHSAALAAWQESGAGRVATDENGKQLTIWDALMGKCRERRAAQPELKQTEAASLRTILGTAIKQMEAKLEQLQTKQEQLANVASAEELDALEMEIRARQKLIYATNQGADDMELHLYRQRVEMHEERRKEFEQMRLSGA